MLSCGSRLAIVSMKLAGRFFVRGTQKGAFPGILNQQIILKKYFFTTVFYYFEARSYLLRPLIRISLLCKLNCHFSSSSTNSPGPISNLIYCTNFPSCLHTFWMGQQYAKYNTSHWYTLPPTISNQFS